jgi:hypothetical protein
MLRSATAVVAGFLFLWSTLIVGGIVIGPRLVPALGLRFVGAVLGGWLAARVAPRAPFAHAAVLAMLVLILSVGSMASAAGYPMWYGAAAVILGVGGVLAGGWLRTAAAEPAN